MKLPIIVQKDINTYLCDALPLCIIQAHPHISKWCLSHYIELFSVNKSTNENKCDDFRLFFAEGGTYLDRHKTREVLEYNHIYSQPIIDNIGIIAFLKENLDSGFYAILFLDEFFIEVKKEYMNQSFIHESLVYGYDVDKEVFHAISFNYNQTFVAIEIPFSQLDFAFNSAFEKSYESAIWSYIHLLKPINAFVDFNYHDFKHQFENYICSKMDLVNKYHLFAFDKDTDLMHIEYTFGSSIYDKMIEIYKQGLPLSINDQYMNFHLLYEHKRSIYTKIDYINNKILNNGILTLLETYQKIVKRHNILRNFVLKMKIEKLEYTKVLSDVMKVDSKITDELESIKLIERQVLMEVMASL